MSCCLRCVQQSLVVNRHCRRRRRHICSYPSTGCSPISPDAFDYTGCFSSWCVTLWYEVDESRV